MSSESLGLRLVIPLAGVLIAYGGIHTYLFVTAQEKEIRSEAETHTLQLANTIRSTTRYAMLEKRREDVHKMIENVGRQEGIEHVRILNKQGEIIYSSNPAEIHQVVDKRAEACYQCHEAQQPLTKLGTSQRTRVFPTDNGERTLAAIEVIYNESSCSTAACHAHPEEQNVLGVVDIGVSLAEADRRVARNTRYAIAIGFVSTVVICGFVTVFIHRFVSRPVHRLLECTRKVARGDLSCSIDPVGNDEIGHLATSFRDMTGDLRIARKELSEWANRLEAEVEHKTRDLKVAQAQIVRSEKLSSIGLLAAGVAHELNSPLMGILTFAQLLIKKTAEGSPEQKDLQVIVRQTERCATIIRQLLDFSRESPVEKKSVDVHVILQQAIDLVERQSLFHDIEIRREFDRSLPPLRMDAGGMQQVFLNLLINAGEAMPFGGSITIHTQASPPAAGAAGPPGCHAIRIVFRDTGTGIPPENLPRIFDPFFTSKDVGHGTGLGLAVSYGIIERHAGSIDVHSALGHGTTFTILLPVDAAGPTTPPTAST